MYWYDAILVGHLSVCVTLCISSSSHALNTCYIFASLTSWPICFSPFVLQCIVVQSVICYWIYFGILCSFSCDDCVVFFPALLFTQTGLLLPQDKQGSLHTYVYGIAIPLIHSLFWKEVTHMELEQFPLIKMEM